ncbi:hypothetical protein KM914_14420 [Virgibacillus pantothenticus]|uniref:DUF6877 family protein n=1 Tax=Virgibacillus pantothenticus TaxID=1473 RepID=UPI001C24D472|nr:DUF6877 family protein [Virgibacillus pantothenticus]MBU8567615.1 hypothetical protein [Virgibacillus pantothenticus]MBU8601403.1 hypothetical protein [Virgibacillus pantothenticus]MBU8636220.1 hypothetical protein [Virgibacillus pantothenticus]MBU8643740.1 hypothetical protein [Virgibacillus pantothenticus]MBU8648004.1 hypothetical protein [Virgibacillus pantothenticus]
MNPIEELHQIAHLVPMQVLMDIDKRITDWIAAGGNENDPYIEQQVSFAKRFVGGEAE